MNTNSYKLTILIPVIIFVIAFGWRLIGINSQGETWDEIAYYNAGKQYLQNIKHFDFNSSHWDANKEHPPVAKYIYGLVSIKPYLENKVDYTPGRVASAFMGALTVLLVYFIGKYLFSCQVGILAALILAFTPYLVGLNKVYGLDTPTVLFFTLTAFLFLKAVTKNSNFYYFISAISLGLSIGVRFNNLLLYPLLILILLIFKGKNFILGKDRKYLWHILTFAIIPILIFFLSWPWLWSDTVNHLNITLGHWSQVNEIYFGQNIIAPYSYYFIYFLVSTPFLLIFLIVPYLFLMWKEKNKYLWIIFLWLMIPFLWTFAVIRQDGVRYILMIYPPLAIICAYVLSKIKSDKVYLISSMAVVFYLIVSNILIHPYYLDYYNEIFSGPKNVYEKKLFQIGWWGEGLEEATAWLNKNAALNSTIYYNVIPNHTIGYTRSDLANTTSENADYIVINTNSEWYKNAIIDLQKYKLVYEVKASNAPLAKIYEKIK